MQMRRLYVHHRQALRAFLAAALAGVLMAGCGIRGNLEAPPEAKASGQVTRPDAADAAGSSSAEQKQSHKGFILDGLIR